MKPSGNPNAKLLYLLTVLLLVMVVSIASLIRTNSALEKRNRALVLQKDSIMAVNKKMTHALQQQANLQWNAAAQKSSRQK